MTPAFSEIGVSCDNSVHGQDAHLLDQDRGVAGVIDGISDANWDGKITAARIMEILGEPGQTLLTAVQKIIDEDGHHACLSGLQRCQDGIQIATFGDTRIYHANAGLDGIEQITPAQTGFESHVRRYLPPYLAEVESCDPNFPVLLLAELQRIPQTKPNPLLETLTTLINRVLVRENLTPMSSEFLFSTFKTDDRVRNAIALWTHLNDTAIPIILNQIEAAGFSSQLILDICLKLTNSVTYCLSSAPEDHAIWFSRRAVQSGDTLILFTDGIRIARQDVLRVLQRERDLQTAAEILTTIWRDRDDGTTVIVKIA